MIEETREAKKTHTEDGRHKKLTKKDSKMEAEEIEKAS